MLICEFQSEIAKMRFDAQEFSSWKEDAKKMGEEIKALEYSKSLIDTYVNVAYSPLI